MQQVSILNQNNDDDDDDKNVQFLQSVWQAFKAVFALCLPCNFWGQALYHSWFVIFILLPRSVLGWDWRLSSSLIWSIEAPICHSLPGSLMFTITIKVSIMLRWNPCLSFTVSEDTSPTIQTQHSQWLQAFLKRKESRPFLIMVSFNWYILILQVSSLNLVNIHHKNGT